MIAEDTRGAWAPTHRRPGLRYGALLVIAGMAAPSWAQTTPDAGRVLDDNLRIERTPLAPSVEFSVVAAPVEEAAPGGATVELTGVRITGASVHSEARLLEELGDVRGRNLDLAGLQGLANAVTRFYRASGYPFARAFLPEQDLATGELVIAVVEGNYGQVVAVGEPSNQRGASRFLGALESGQVIEAGRLERTTLLLGDLPGVMVTPTMRPGTALGTGDLHVVTDTSRRWEADLGTENHGNRYSGEYRANADVRFNRALLFGDQLRLQATYTNEGLWLAQAGYSLPLGGRGLRAAVSHAHTAYDLRAPFEDYSGTAKVSGAELSYPLIRSRQTNLMLSAGYRYKDLDTKLDGFSIDAKSSHGWPLGVQYDRRDSLGGAGVTWAVLEATPGRVKAEAPGATDGSFVRVQAQLARLQDLPGALSLLARVSGQWADSELDSSESFVLGGSSGVRAYPQGEAVGSEGWLGQLELRYSWGDFMPFAFFDVGRIAEDALAEKRELGGAGLGLRMQRAGFYLDSVAAMRVMGGSPQSDDRSRDPRLWFSLGYSL